MIDENALLGGLPRQLEGLNRSHHVFTASRGRNETFEKKEYRG
jgi:hypothetical protein